MADAKDTFVMQDALEEYALKDKQRLLGYDEGEGDDKTHVNGVKDDLESEIATAQTTLNAAITQALTDAKAYADGVDLDIEEEASTYVYTFTFTKADGTVYTKKIDLPIEEFVLSASYSDGKLTISLKNGESVAVDISALISGLVNQTDFDTLTDVVNGNTDDIEELQETKADKDDLDDYEKSVDLGGDVDEILAGKGYLDGDDKTELEGKITTAQNTANSADTNATQALLETAELQKTSNTGLRFFIREDDGMPCVEYL